jgi:magnesium transporter
MPDETTLADSRGASAQPLRDEEGAIDEAYVAQVATAIAAADKGALQVLVGDLHEADAGDLIEALDADLRRDLIEQMGATFDFAALTEVDDSVREELLESLSPGTVAAGVRELESDDAVYLLEDLPLADQTAILRELPASERAALERSLYYPEDSAGRRMQSDFIAVAPFWTVGQTIDYLRETPDLPDQFFQIYVVDPAHRLLGTVALDRILRTKRPVPIADLVEEDQRSVRATDDQEEVARLFERYNLVAVPVIDAADRLVGVITVDDVVDVISEEADEDLKALGGVRATEELSDTVWETAKRRFPWLLANMVTAFLAASVIRLFESSVEKMVALAVLMPIIASMGGNAGTQSMTIAVRALATRELSRSNAGRVVRRELLVGIMNGIGFAVIMGALAAAWFGIADLGLVVGVAVITVLAIAALGGILIPLALARLGADPAVSSGPFVTTITDMVCFFAFLGIATFWFALS